ncbi:hypothetical protein [Actinomadura fibrosa]|uniref:Uncharacterized protein n=1 Tax=Actinomadura fibrosa TaxID=111802 RepID=A0ABW2XW74_9ACTN|nr:hypothetical protein [Actinomadura fibrosa]
MECHDSLTVGFCDDFTDPAWQPAARERAVEVLTEADHRIEPHPCDEDDELRAVRPRWLWGAEAALPGRGEPMTAWEGAAPQAHNCGCR